MKKGKRGPKRYKQQLWLEILNILDSDSRTDNFGSMIYPGIENTKTATGIIFRARMTYKHTTLYLNQMLKSGIIGMKDVEYRTQMRKEYYITEKGYKFLKLLREQQEEIDKYSFHS